ncbi:tautomerase family protein [Krasilnikovia sp. MM14-A1259]|uniref:tautomerase family protein n=1 Tax=Krasilnikovia sp. MM14-A1259 TaxID=3373539 RepID=UPI00380D4D40
MPMIEITGQSGVLSAEERVELPKRLAAILLRWEGAPDTAKFRALSWGYLRELPADAVSAASGDGLPRWRIDVTVPEGALSPRRTEGLVDEVTRAVLEAAGLGAEDAHRVWVLVHTQPDGSWGAGGKVVRSIDLSDLAAAERAELAASASAAHR